jgi:hypothetical protein
MRKSPLGLGFANPALADRAALKYPLYFEPGIADLTDDPGYSTFVGSFYFRKCGDLIRRLSPTPARPLVNELPPHRLPFTRSRVIGGIKSWR